MKIKALAEGLRFGAKERAELQKKLNKVIVGLEYEYHVRDFTPTHGKTMDDIFNMAERRRDEYAFKKADKDVREAADSIKAFRALGLYVSRNERTLNQFDKFLNYGGIDMLEEAMQELIEADGESSDAQESVDIGMTIFGNLKSSVDSIPDVLSIDEPEILELVAKTNTDIDIVLDQIVEFVDVAKDIPTGTSKIIDNVIELSDFLEDTGFISIATAAMDMIAELQSAFDWNRADEIEEIIANKRARDYGVGWENSNLSATLDRLKKDFPQDESAKYIEDMLGRLSGRWGIDMNDIESITTDPTVEQGVEVISKPLPFAKQLQLMKGMFKHIDDVGRTSRQTGLHVNMSIRGKDFERNNFNPLKLALLIDNQYMMKNFPARNMVDDIWRIVSPEALLKLAKDAGSNKELDVAKHTNVREIERGLRSMLMYGGKYQGINFENLELPKSREQRVEFRYIGDALYTKKFDEIVGFMERFAFMMFAAYDDKFGEKEYKQKLIQQLNRLSAKHFQMSWSELVKAVRERGDKFAA